VARNRNRAKERRRTRPTSTRPPQPRDLEAAGDLEAAEENGAPDPLAHATPDAELAEAQLAVGQPELTETFDSPDDEDELEELATGAGDAGRAGEEAGNGGGGAGRLPAVPGGAHAARREPIGSRLIGFLKGSWAELQRVQWPDRRQVMQATSVVIGFVIVAGVFLGVADWAAGKIMTYILK
jgi:preprotein translocase subunit SecE